MRRRRNSRSMMMAFYCPEELRMTRLLHGSCLVSLYYIEWGQSYVHICVQYLLLFLRNTRRELAARVHERCYCSGEAAKSVGVLLRTTCFSDIINTNNTFLASKPASF